ncbi:YhzD family protein [Bacillus salitolerans]|uniref:YhzD family protein n=1 Tax=Bacillus salitolerans TaxID=1437434 RepID=A0ABW4LWA6_9BACI
MPIFTLTVFDKSGNKLVDENFEASSEAEAKTKGEQILTEKGFEEHTHRCVNASGKLILFHR